MRRRLILFLMPAALVLFLGSTGIARAFSEKGPFHVRNQYPPHLMFMDLSADSARPIPHHRLSIGMAIDYTSVFVNEKSGNWEALIDMEMTSVDLSLVYGLTKNLSVSVSMPFVSMNAGFLDPLLEDFHNTFGLPNYGKHDRPKDEFAYAVRENGEDWFTAQSGGFHRADGTISARLSLYGEKPHSPMSGSILYKLKIPIGDAEHGFGSGEFDHGLFLLSQFRFDPFILYLNPGIMALSKPDTLGLQVPINSTIFGLVLGCEYVPNTSWTLLTQLNYYGSPFADTGISHLDNHSLQLIFGLTHEISQGTVLELTFSEDLSRTAPDFTVHTRIVFDWDL